MCYINLSRSVPAADKPERGVKRARNSRSLALVEERGMPPSGRIGASRKTVGRGAPPRPAFDTPIARTRSRDRLFPTAARRQRRSRRGGSRIRRTRDAHQSGTGISEPYRSAISAGSASILCRQSRHQTMKCRGAAAAFAQRHRRAVLGHSTFIFASSFRPTKTGL